MTSKLDQVFLKSISVGNIAVFIFALIAPILLADTAKAAGFSEAYVRFDRMSASTATGGMVCAKPSTVATEGKVLVTFPTGFSLDTTAANWTTSTTNLPSGATAWASIGSTATSVAGQVATFASGDLTVGTLYCFNFTGTSTLTTSTAGNDKLGTIETQTGASAAIDNTTYATSIVSNDQITVTAVVPATFSFALSGNTDTFTSNLSTTTTSTSGRTVTIATNAASGWVAWVKSTNAGLNSASTGSSIATAGTVDDAPTDLTSATGYVLDVDVTTDSATGTGTVSQSSGYGAEYNGTNTTSGGTLATTYQPIAASSGTTDGDVLTLTERAKINAIQAAASDYTDTLTVVAAGRF